jgi:hypothetical protein
MWIRCGPACKRVFRKAGRCDRVCCEVQLGMVTAMAQMIEFYVPQQFRKPAGKMESTQAVREDPSFSRT